MSKLAIFGAGGHGKVVADCALKSAQYQEIVFLDGRYPEILQLEGWSVVGDEATVSSLVAKGYHFFVAIGNNRVRQKVQRQLEEQGATIATLIHPNASVGMACHIGQGCLILAGAVVNAFTEIGAGTIVNTRASVDHDGHVSEFVHIAPGASIAGQVSIGEATFIGIGSAVIQCVSIGSDVTVGAGATVVNSISDSLVVVGTPATEINSQKRSD